MYSQQQHRLLKKGSKYTTAATSIINFIVYSLFQTKMD